MTAPRFDVEVAGRFLELLQPDDMLISSMCWLALHDSDKQVRPRQTHATLTDVHERLAFLNWQGFGIFVAINAVAPTWAEKGSAKRPAESVTRIRAVFGDFDDPKVPLPVFDLAPSILVQTSPGKHHAYWLVDPDDPLPVQEFDSRQRGIIQQYKASGADRSILAPNRMMRLPGSMHCKTEARHMVQIVEAPGHRYSAQQLRSAFPYITPARRGVVPDVAWDGEIPADLVLVARYVAAVYPQRADGAFNVECPWADEHTVDSGASATTWWPPSEKNNGRGGFRCHHSHCQHRGADAYHRLIREHIEKATP